MPSPKPEDYHLIATLWYTTREDGKPNAQKVDYNTNPVNSDAYSDIRSLYSSPSNPSGFGPLGNDFTISYQGVRTPDNNSNSAITKSSFNETFLINVPSGSFEASAVYYDTGSGTETTVKENIFTVTGGKGLFHDASIALITYDNSGEKFGQLFCRRVEVFSLKNSSSTIPDLNGEWEQSITVLRRNNQFEFPDLNKLITVTTIGTIVQKGQFLTLELPPDDLRPVAGFLLGALTYEQNGWKLTFADFDDNGVYNVYPSKFGPSGEILELAGNYTEGGFAGQSPTQLQTIGIPTLKRMKPLTI
jgi:hypothetical protein